MSILATAVLGRWIKIGAVAVLGLRFNGVSFASIPAMAKLNPAETKRLAEEDMGTEERPPY
jgi:hypothetical protein